MDAATTQRLMSPLVAMPPLSTPVETVQVLTSDAPGTAHLRMFATPNQAPDTSAGVPHARGRRDSTYSAIEAVVDEKFDREDDYHDSDSDEEGRRDYDDVENEDDNKSPTVLSITSKSLSLNRVSLCMSSCCVCFVEFTLSVFCVDQDYEFLCATQLDGHVIFVPVAF